MSAKVTANDEKLKTYEEKLKNREQAMKTTKEPITHPLEIGWNAAVGKWVVSEPQKAVWRDVDVVEWTLVGRDAADRSVSAHFQFPDMQLFDGEHDPQNVEFYLSPDKTATIKEPGKTLTLKVHSKACRRTNPHHYAVWIRDASLPNGGDYAVGKDLNPPPEINVGP